MLVESPSGAAVHEDVVRVRAAIATLPPADRDLLVLRFAGDLATEALATRLGTTPATVLRRLHHAGWVVEDLAGSSAPADGSGLPRLVDRPTELVEEEAGAGITPLLAARLAAAVTGPRPDADDHWRLHRFVRGVRDHADGVLTMVLVAALAMPVVASLVPL